MRNTGVLKISKEQFQHLPELHRTVVEHLVRKGKVTVVDSSIPTQKGEAV